MSDIGIRIEGRAGRITLRRPKALNALTYDMLRAIEAALEDWRHNGAVSLVIIDAEGDKAFCAGGDIADLYATGKAGDFAYGQKFWRDEYRLNAKLAEYPKPIVSFMQGFTMGGGVGIGCHARHRVVNAQSVVAMPECGIGLVPDVGGSLLLARAPGFIGTYLGTTANRLSGADIIYTGFADYLIDVGHWQALKADLIATGDPAGLHKASAPDRESPAKLLQMRPRIDRHFSQSTLTEILASLHTPAPEDAAFAQETLAALVRNAPLSVAYTIKMLHRLRAPGASLHDALDLEYRFTHRAMQYGDFLEGIRAAIIDKDRSPRWQHDLDAVPAEDINRMMAPLGDNALNWENMP